MIHDCVLNSRLTWPTHGARNAGGNDASASSNACSYSPGSNPKTTSLNQNMPPGFRAAAMRRSAMAFQKSGMWCMASCETTASTGSPSCT